MKIKYFEKSNFSRTFNFTRFARSEWNNFVKNYFYTGNNPLDFQGSKTFCWELAWDLIFLQLFSLFFRVRVFVPFFCVSLFLKKSLLFLKDKELMLKFLVEDEEVAVLKAKRLRLYKHNRRIAWFRPTANSRTPTTFGNATRQKMLVSCWAGKRIGHLFIGSTWEKPKTTKNFC